MTTDSGEISHVKQQVISVRTAAPGRKAQIIANQWQNGPLADLCKEMPPSGRIVLAFSGQGEKVLFVVPTARPVGAHPHQAVVAIPLFADDKAAREHGPQLFCLPAHPLHRRPRHALGILCSLHRKARSKHLGQHHQIRFALEVFEPFGKCFSVSRRLFPQQISLHQTYAQCILHVAKLRKKIKRKRGLMQTQVPSLCLKGAMLRVIYALSFRFFCHGL